MSLGIYGLVSTKSDSSKKEYEVLFDKYSYDPTSKNLINAFQVTVSILMCFGIHTINYNLLIYSDVPPVRFAHQPPDLLAATHIFAARFIGV